MAKQKLPLKVVELFAGVGGFRLGLEGAKQEHIKEYKTVWSNQWEPGTKVQHASNIYTKHWGKKNHANQDIMTIDVADIPAHDLLVGGFPCQDYSVARNLGQASGIIGKKGVLWWGIHRILKMKGKKAPSYLMLENVDRLLKSPAKHRGRDFSIMLASLCDLGYIVEWRVINAADYGMPQRRRRIFILGYRKGTPLYEKILKNGRPLDWILEKGTMALAFPVKDEERKNVLLDKGFRINGDLSEITIRAESQLKSKSPFENAGIIIDREVFTVNVKPDYKGRRVTLGDILIDEREVADEYFLNSKSLPQWKYLKGAKNEERTTRAGFSYVYTEGGMVFPDALDKPSRTIITSEGGPNPSRFKHVIKTPSGKLRRLVPLELERLNQFPDNHTAGVSDNRRAFFMGNALVVGVIERLGKQLIKAING